MKKNYDRSVSLNCPTCANTQFEFDEALSEDERTYICVSCDARYSYDEIREANSEKIAAGISDMKAEVLKDIKADFKKIFK